MTGTPTHSWSAGAGGSGVSSETRPLLPAATAVTTTDRSGHLMDAFRCCSEAPDEQVISKCTVALNPAGAPAMVLLMVRLVSEREQSSHGEGRSDGGNL